MSSSDLEKKRLNTLHSYQLRYTKQEEALDAITQLASEISQCPIALVSLVYDDVQWFKSKVGLEIDETPRALSFCAHTIHPPHDILVVEDARVDERFQDNPLVKSDPSIVFYTGIPLVLEGQIVGTLCVIDRQPRKLTPTQLNSLKLLSQQVTQFLNQHKIERETERKARAIQQYANMEKQFQLTEKVTGWEYDPTEESVYLTANTMNWLPFGTDSVIDMNAFLNAFQAAEQPEKIVEAIERLVQDREDFSLTVAIKNQAGSIEKWVKILGKHFIDNEGKSTFGGLIQDITQEYATLAELQQQKQQKQLEAEFYKSLIDNDIIYIVKTDIEGNYSYVNDYFCKLLGMPRTDIIGRASLESIIPADHEKCMQAVELCFADPASSHKVLLRKNTTRGLVTNYWDFKALLTEAGEIAEILCLGYEVSELVKKQAELEKLNNEVEFHNQQLSNFTHIMSHDIRNHIGNIQSLNYLMQQANEQEKKEYLSIMHESVNNLNNTIENLHELIKIQSSKDLPMTHTNIYEVVMKVIQVLNDKINATDTTVHIFVDEESSLFTNTAYMESILQNLISNAIKYRKSDVKNEIKIYFVEGDQQAKIQVVDNGQGMDLESIGDQLFRMYKTFHNHPDARGMGLFITKNQIEALGGSIEVQSTPVKGTTFTVTLPNKRKQNSQVLEKTIFKPYL